MSGFLQIAGEFDGKRLLDREPSANTRQLTRSYGIAM
jgi:hypothetical protein